MARPARVIGVLEVAEQPSAISVKLLDHRAVERVGLPFLFPIVSMRFGQFDPQLIAIFVQQLFAASHHRRMHQPGGEIEEERLILVALKKRHRILRGLVEREAVVVQTIRVLRIAGGEAGQAVLQTGVGAAAVARVVKALILRLRITAMVAHRHMPLSAVAGGVAVRFQRLGNRNCFAGHPRRVPRRHHVPAGFVMRARRIASGDVRHLRARRMIAAQNRGARRRTGRCRRVRLPKLDPFFCKRINMRGLIWARRIDIVAF